MTQKKGWIEFQLGLKPVVNKDLIQKSNDKKYIGYPNSYYLFVIQKSVNKKDIDYIGSFLVMAFSLCPSTKRQKKCIVCFWEWCNITQKLIEKKFLKRIKNEQAKNIMM